MHIRELNVAELDAVFGGDKKPPPGSTGSAGLDKGLDKAKDAAAQLAHEIMHALGLA